MNLDGVNGIWHWPQKLLTFMNDITCVTICISLDLEELGEGYFSLYGQSHMNPDKLVWV